MATKPNTPGETDMGPSVLKGKMRPVSWNALEKVESFTKVVKAKLDRLKARQSPKIYPKTPLSNDDLDRVIMAIWCVCYSGMQWRTVAFLTKLPFGTVYSCFSRWTRLGLWKAIVSDLLQQWRETWGDRAEPSVLVMDSRSCRSAPTCGQRGIDGGKKIKGVKINLMVDKHAIPVAVAIATANAYDTVGILTPLKEVANKGFRGKALGDLSYPYCGTFSIRVGITILNQCLGRYAKRPPYLPSH